MNSAAADEFRQLPILWVPSRKQPEITVSRLGKPGHTKIPTRKLTYNLQGSSDR
jgi:hypothetical protein